MRFGVVLFAAALVMSDWPTERTSEHWTGYPMFTSIVSGLLLLVVTYMVVDEAIQRQNSAKWASVANSGFKALGEIAADVSDGLAELVTGVDDRSTSGTSTMLPAALRRRARELTAFDGPPNRMRDRPEHRDAFLAALRRNLESGPWCDVAQRATVNLRETVRDELAVWLAAMLATAELARIANRVALLDRRLASLQGPILWISRIEGGERETDDEGHDADYFREVVYRMMQAAFLETAALIETLNRLADADRTSYRLVHWRLRNRLDDRHLQWLVDHEDTLVDTPEEPVIGDTFEGDYIDRVIVPPATPAGVRRLVARLTPS